jgi:hypothetical protein
MAESEGKNLVAKEIEFKVKKEKSPDYRIIYATGAEGGNFGAYDLRISFYDTDVQPYEEQLGSEKIAKRIFKETIVLSYAAAKELSDWLVRHIEYYEKESGMPIYTGNKDNALGKTDSVTDSPE